LTTESSAAPRGRICGQDVASPLGLGLTTLRVPVPLPVLVVGATRSLHRVASGSMSDSSCSNRSSRCAEANGQIPRVPPACPVGRLCVAANQLSGLGVAAAAAALSPWLRSLSLTRPNGRNRSKVAVLANQDRSVTSGMVRGLSSGTWTGWVDGV
jgi:hypothetical protein